MSFRPMLVQLPEDKVKYTIGEEVLVIMPEISKPITGRVVARMGKTYEIHIPGMRIESADGKAYTKISTMYVQPRFLRKK